MVVRGLSIKTVAHGRVLERRWWEVCDKMVIPNLALNYFLQP